MGRWRGPIMLISAAVLALITTLLVYNLLKQRTGVRARGTLPMQTVVVAAIDLSWGSKLSPDVLKAISLPIENLPTGYHSNIDDVGGRVLINKVVANEPILESKLAPIGTKAGISGLIDKERRAMSVKVDEVIGVAGFIYPGSNVDVLATIRQGAGIKEPTTKVILQNVPVLATGTKMEVKEGETIAVSVVTLEVLPKDAEKLALAATEGRIRLAMRNPIDDKSVETAGVTTSGLVSRARRRGPSGKVLKGISVVVIRGSNVSRQTL